MNASPSTARSWSSRGSHSASEAASMSIAHSVEPLNASICRPSAIRRVSITMSLSTNSRSSRPLSGITNQSPFSGVHGRPASRRAAARSRLIIRPVWTRCAALRRCPARVGDVPTYLLEEIRRYPVKAMGGESLESVTVDGRGLVGDRAYAVVDGDGKLATGKHSRRFRRRDEIFEFAACTTSDGVDVSGRGHAWSVPSRALETTLSEAMGDPVRVLAETTTPYFDAGQVSVVGTASLDWCREHLG